jgi:hypothetical protein
VTDATENTGSCQVRSGTDLPCGRPASVRMLGVLFCERCAREQEAYFAIGDLTRARDPLAAIPGIHGGYGDGPIRELLARLRRNVAGVGEAQEQPGQNSLV